MSFGEIVDAVQDKRLTREEGKEFLPGVYGEGAETAAETAARVFGIDLDELADRQREANRLMQSVADSFRQPPVLIGPLVDPQVAATREVRAELAGVADILKTTGDQIVTMATLAASTVATLEQVYRETAQLRDALVEFKNEAATASTRLDTLTRWLIVFTIVLVVVGLIVAIHDLAR